MTPLAQAVLGLLSLLGAGIAGRALARALRLSSGPERPLGWEAAMAELEPPELPLSGYSDQALREEADATYRELARLLAWVKAEPRDDEAKRRALAVERRRDELSAELIRRIDLETAQLQAKIDAMPPGPRDDVVEIRRFGGGVVHRLVERCTCANCKREWRLSEGRDTLAGPGQGRPGETPEER